MKLGFALKVGRWCSFGFAAGCEAVAVPRRRRPDLFPGYAPGSGFAPRVYWAKGRTRGRAQR